MTTSAMLEYNPPSLKDDHTTAEGKAAFAEALQISLNLDFEELNLDEEHDHACAWSQFLQGALRILRAEHEYYSHQLQAHTKHQGTEDVICAITTFAFRLFDYVKKNVRLLFLVCPFPTKRKLQTTASKENLQLLGLDQDSPCARFFFN
jgi:hypothetical protein